MNVPELSPFDRLNQINCNDRTEKRNGLTYLSWAWAWMELKKAYPASFYTIYENASGLFYHTDGTTCWVKTGVTLVDENGVALEHIEYLPVMDYRNKSILLENVTSFDVNKSIQRSLTKAVARHGLGLYIYAGEDLPEGAEEPEQNNEKPETKPEELPKPKPPALSNIICQSCQQPIPAETLINGKRYTAEQVAKGSAKAHGKMLCYRCKLAADRAAETATETA